MSREAHTAAWRWERRGCKVKAGDRLVATLGLAGLGEDDLNARGRLIAAAPAMEAALAKIEDLARPGQTLGISEAIDLICDIYNVARSARAAIHSATGEG